MAVSRVVSRSATKLFWLRRSEPPLIVPQSTFEDRYTRLDLRVSKRMQLTQRVRLTGNLNLYNLFNKSAIQIENVNYGALWLQPSLIEDGRMVQVSANLIF